jgi:hypothetical protein
MNLSDITYQDTFAVYEPMQGGVVGVGCAIHDSSHSLLCRPDMAVVLPTPDPTRIDVPGSDADSKWGCSRRSEAWRWETVFKYMKPIGARIKITKLPVKWHGEWQHALPKDDPTSVQADCLRYDAASRAGGAASRGRREEMAVPVPALEIRSGRAGPDAYTRFWDQV